MSQLPLIEALRVIALPNAQCKCCGLPAPLYGVVDFHKNCEIQRGKQVLPLSGLAVYYYRCPFCGLIFTVAFDGFDQEDFGRFIYNGSYATVDPDYAESRPVQKAQMLANFFAASKSIRILDYGGGNGRLSEVLRAAGFARVATYDPFVPAFAQRPAGKFDLVVSFEVVEHSHKPRETFADILSFVADDGMLLFSTLIQPPDIGVQGVNWWYVAPRNGHVTIYSRTSLERLAVAATYNFISANDDLHVFVRKVPAFAQHLIRPKPTS